MRRALACLAFFVVPAAALTAKAHAWSPARLPHARAASPLPRRAQHAAMHVGEGSSLAELRAFVKSRGLPVKTSGAGRTKAAILEDILAVLGSAAPEQARGAVEAEGEAGAGGAADAPPPAEAAAIKERGGKKPEAPASPRRGAKASGRTEKPKAKAKRAEAGAAAEEAVEDAAEKESASEEGGSASQMGGQPPSGFEWGGVF
ncbi:hypothetical protein AB1Y20_012799 [Prymnesium parvum]|uniref:SAP domain-containing protein n=1 Tax=Prymnesium parvum TaxID=97485 RepID=A0AB34IMG4_PRYPA